MRTRPLATTLAIVGVGCLGFTAIAAANAVSTNPAPAPVVKRAFLPSSQAGGGSGRDHAEDDRTTTSTTVAVTVTVPAVTPTTVDDHGGDRPAGVSDDPAGHDVGDDHGGSSGGSGRGGADDGSGHDVGDDHGSGGHGGDD